MGNDEEIQHWCQPYSNIFMTRPPAQSSLIAPWGNGFAPPGLLSPTLINIVLDRVMTDAFEDHVGTVSIGGRTVTNLSFADYIDGLEGDEQELVNLVSRLDKTSASYGMVLRKPS